MPDEYEKACGDWWSPDALWERLVPVLPPRTPHPVGCHRPRVDDRHARDALFFVLRTGCPWGALDATGLGAPQCRPPPLPSGTEADVFVAFWQQGLVDSDALRGMDGEWLARDGARTTAPLGGKRGAST